MRKLLWLTLALALLLGAIWQFYPLPDATQRMDALPLYGREFLGRNLELSPFEKDLFANVNVLKRLYQVGDQNLFITALDGTRNRHVVHDPFYCFRGGGWELLDKKVVPVPNGEAMFLNLQRNDQLQEALYWFTDGHQQYTSPLRYWWQATLRRLTLGRSGPEPILVVVQPVDAQTLDLDALLKQFPTLFAL